MKVIAIVLLGATLAGCSVDPKALTGAGTGAAGLLGFYGTTASLEQQLFEDTIKQDAILHYLQPQLTCTDNPGFRRLSRGKPLEYKIARNIQTEELDRLERADKVYQFLLKYSKAFDAIVKQSAETQQAVDDLVSAGIALAGVVPYSSPYTAIARTTQRAFAAVGVIDTARQLHEAAKKYKPQLKEHVALLQVRLPAMDRATTTRINIWRACTEEKFDAMRKLAANKTFPSSVVELETSYAAFQAQYRSFVVTAPQVGHMLTAIVKANDAIAVTTDPAVIRASVDNLVAAVNAVNAVYVAAGAVPR